MLKKEVLDYKKKSIKLIIFKQDIILKFSKKKEKYLNIVTSLKQKSLNKGSYIKFKIYQFFATLYQINFYNKTAVQISGDNMEKANL